MLIIEKQDDIKTLRDMGATRKRIKRIYFFEGFLIAFTGMVIGLFIGLLVCWVQQQFGLVKLKGMFVIDAYPVRVEGFDFLIVFLIVGSIGFLSSLYPVNKLIKRGV
ncbi:MAG: FtsX-like permease family protein [Bacteroidales bacterium]|nr:FtsX-like permease family protein [Bacteroidales bacterium]